MCFGPVEQQSSSGDLEGTWSSEFASLSEWLSPVGMTPCAAYGKPLVIQRSLESMAHIVGLMRNLALEKSQGIHKDDPK